MVQKMSLVAEKVYEEMTDTLFNLYERWADEKEFEDFDEYKEVITKKFNSLGCESKLISIGKRPFGIKYTTVDAGDLRMYLASMTSTSYQYKRIK